MRRTLAAESSLRWSGPCLAVLLSSSGTVQGQPPWPPPYREPVPRVVETGAPDDLPWTVEEAVLRSENLKKARLNGKYRMLMLQFDARDSVHQYGDFRELGLATRPPGVSLQAGLPQAPLRGYWVYAAPSWYVWHELATPDIVKRDGGVEQVLGPPNTTFTGKRFPTAWTTKLPDAQDEWLLLEFEHPLQPCRLQIYESLHPGAVKRITMMAEDGSEVEVWSGLDPTRAVEASGAMFELVLKYPPAYDFIDPDPTPRTIFATNRVKLYLDSAAVADWNEIDAVALMDYSNNPVWASAALASSSYADRSSRPDAELPAALIGGWAPVRPPIGVIDLSLLDLAADLPRQ